jgi:hypothetical protein
LDVRLKNDDLRFSNSDARSTMHEERSTKGRHFGVRISEFELDGSRRLQPALNGK